MHFLRKVAICMVVLIIIVAGFIGFGPSLLSLKENQHEIKGESVALQQ